MRRRDVRFVSGTIATGLVVAALGFAWVVSRRPTTAREGQPESGAQAFATHCAACHDLDDLVGGGVADVVGRDDEAQRAQGVGGLLGPTRARRAVLHEHDGVVRGDDVGVGAPEDVEDRLGARRVEAEDVGAADDGIDARHRVRLQVRRVERAEAVAELEQRRRGQVAVDGDGAGADVDEVGEHADVGGAIDLHWRFVGDGARLEFSVADNGAGMAAELVAKIGEPFLADGSATALRGERGTGLGFHICKKLVDLLGGTLSVDSTPGEGTTVSVQWPLQSLSPELQPR